MPNACKRNQTLSTATIPFAKLTFKLVKLEENKTLTVSSVHMADICVPNMIAVNIPNNNPSNIRNMRNIV